MFVEEAHAYIKFKGMVYKIRLSEFEHTASADTVESIRVEGIVVDQAYDFEDSSLDL